MDESWVSMQVKGIRSCACSAHPLLVLQEVGDGLRAITVGLPVGEARLLHQELEGKRTRHSRSLATIAQVLSGLGGSPVLRLTGDWETGLRGEIVVRLDAREVLAAAHPGDVAAIAWRLGIPVLVPIALVSDEDRLRLGRLEVWRPEYAGRQDDPWDPEAFRRFLENVSPQDFHD